MLKYKVAYIFLHTSSSSIMYLTPKIWKTGLGCTQRFVIVKVKIELKDIICFILKGGNNHKFFKNCLNCGLIFCQQNLKLTNCTFCTFPFDDTETETKTKTETAVQISKSKDSSLNLKSALNLRNLLLEADLNSNDGKTKTMVKEEFSEFIQTNFCSNSEINARQKEIENFKVKLAKEKVEKSSFDLSKMLGFQ